MSDRKKLSAGALLALMRPQHYIKNCLVFVALVFDKNLLHPEALLRALGGFVAFCLLSSAVYIFNDIHDVAADRKHPVKKNRPIASGAVSVPVAYGLMAVLLVLAFALNWAACGWNGSCFALMLVYLLVNLGYSLGLKQVPFVDIALLVSGFFIRVLYGQMIFGSEISAWVSLTVISLSFYMGLGKRRNELVKNKGGEETRKVLAFYSYQFLDKFMYLCLTLTIAFYSLWTADAAIVEKYQTNKLVWTVPLVILLFMKYSADIESDSYGDPVDVVLHDKSLLLLGVALVLSVLGIIYLPTL